MSRNTVARLLASAEPPRYEREPAGSLLDPFKGAVLEMLREDASVPATVIREHLQREGYGGGITILKDYLASVRPQFKAAPRLRAHHLPARRAPPGRLVGHRRRRAGRQGRAPPRPRPRHDAALLGRPRRGLRPLADHRRRGARPLRLPRAPRRRARQRWSSTTTPASSCAAAALARGPWTSSPACSAASPWAASCCPRGARRARAPWNARNGYLETSFLPLREFADLADLQAQSDAWTADVAWPRHHRRLGARVIEALAVERAELASAARAAADHRPTPRGARLP